ncbi:hypothetical protein KAR91_23290 [Candidatus Pacearchaeota archaeon]|nr:hypothetical protein [Candidatus Pacearchaeota archaeon]
MLISTKKDRGSLYKKIASLDILTSIKPLMEKEGYYVRPDGKVDRMLHATAWDTPWIHQWQTAANDCGLWHRVVFPFFNVVPYHCQNCWKVVVAPRTVEELFDLFELQKELEHPCKCGIELRGTDTRRYGGYFYNHNGREDGEQCYLKVREVVNEAISPDVPVILKCACTEYEQKYGPPLEYEVTDEQRKLEDWITEWVVVPDKVFSQVIHQQAFVMRKWLHHAYATGDETYKKFTDGEPLSRKIKTYHHEIKEIVNG